MNRAIFTASTTAIFLMARIGMAQSLGDIARQQRQERSTATQHVITNDDISSGSSQDSAPQSQAGAKDAASVPAGAENGDRPSASEIQSKIRAERQRLSAAEVNVKDLQAKLDRWKTSDCTHVLYADNTNACGAVARLKTDYDRSSAQLQKEQASLAALQEQARKLGYGSKIYDPQ